MGIVSAPLFWLIIGVILLFLELVLPGFVLFFFGMGALVTSLVAYFFESSLSWQLALFIIASLASLFSLRNVIQRKFLKFSPEDGEDEDVVLVNPGERGVVVDEIIPPAEGRIKYSGTFWRATADEKVDKGEIISIVSQKGLVIQVEKMYSQASS
jgi:membrane protein implicated in regulation of membrane protease activity